MIELVLHPWKELEVKELHRWAIQLGIDIPVTCASAVGNPKEKIRIEPVTEPVPAKTPAPVETPEEEKVPA